MPIARPPKFVPFFLPFPLRGLCVAPIVLAFLLPGCSLRIFLTGGANFEPSSCKNDFEPSCRIVCKVHCIFLASFPSPLHHPIALNRPCTRSFPRLPLPYRTLTSAVSCTTPFFGTPATHHYLFLTPKPILPLMASDSSSTASEGSNAPSGALPELPESLFTRFPSVPPSCWH